MNHDNLKELFPKTIGFFEISFLGSKCKRTGVLKATYQSYKNNIRIYVDYRTKSGIFEFCILFGTIYNPIGFYKTFTTLDECINNINEWCFLNDHLFLPGK